MNKLLLSLLLTAAACGDAPPITPDAGTTVKELLPMKVGNAWTYRVTSSGVTGMKTQTVTGTASFEGKAAFRVRTDSADEDTTTSVQYVENGRLYRPSEDHLSKSGALTRYRFTPPSLRIDSNVTTAGATYDATWMEEKRNAAGTLVDAKTVLETWTVEAAADTVTVPAGTFTCVRVRKEQGAAGTDSSPKTFWYAPGVGKVKEISGQTEELSRVDLAP